MAKKKAAGTKSQGTKRRRGGASQDLLGSVAEDIGASLGNLMNQVDAQVRTAGQQRETAIKGLLAVRDRATALLSDLGHRVMDLPNRATVRKAAAPRKAKKAGAKAKKQRATPAKRRR